MMRPTCAVEQACNVIQDSFSSLQMILIAPYLLCPFNTHTVCLMFVHIFSVLGSDKRLAWH
jgi:hypothetical protein